ncbi:MAG: STAS domain-containing protein [Deltaproteobacteria bacterium]|nr:STAS domain-containing protein [Deltaproteobacteria bacterium]
MKKKKTNEGSAFSLEGALMIHEAMEIYQKYAQAFEGSDEIFLDLSSITDCDTAGVQLLYCIFKSAKESGKKISFPGFSQTVQYAADRIGLEWDGK